MTDLYQRFSEEPALRNQAILQRFSEDMDLAGYSPRSIDMYVRSVRQLSRYYQKDPDQVSDEELREYFLYNKTERGWSRTASTIALCGIKLFFTMTLRRDWTNLKFVRPEKEKKLPVVLSPKEVRKICNAARMPYHRVCLKTIYSLGLRLSEGTHLGVSDIDSDRMFVHVHRGKGNRDRYVPLPKTTLDLLRAFCLPAGRRGKPIATGSGCSRRRGRAEAPNSCPIRKTPFPWTTSSTPSVRPAIRSGSPKRSPCIISGTVEFTPHLMRGDPSSGSRSGPPVRPEVSRAQGSQDHNDLHAADQAGSAGTDPDHRSDHA